MRHLLLVPALLLLASAVPLQAQRIRDAGATFPAEALDAPATPGFRPAPSAVSLGLGGLVGGAVGTFAGAYLGAKATEDECEDCFLEGLVYGGIAGESALLPLGVHLANGRRGNYGLSLLASAAIAGAGVGLAAATHEEGILLAVPVAQLISAIAIERATGR